MKARGKKERREMAEGGEGDKMRFRMDSFFWNLPAVLLAAVVDLVHALGARGTVRTLRMLGVGRRPGLESGAAGRTGRGRESGPRLAVGEATVHPFVRTVHVKQ